MKRLNLGIFPEKKMGQINVKTLVYELEYIVIIMHLQFLSVISMHQHVQ